MKTSLFESVRCSRCGGTGRMPFSVMNGICFKCGGNGFVLTKRGRAAQNFLNAMRQLPAEEFKPGDLICSEGFCAGSINVQTTWHKVVEVRIVEARTASYPQAKEGEKQVTIITDTGGSFGGLMGSTTWRKGFSKEEKLAQRAAALAYQATLTKSGTVKKG